MYSTHPFLQLEHCNCFSLDFRFGLLRIQVHHQVWDDSVEDLLRESLREVIGNVELASDMHDSKLPLSYSIRKPKVPHVHAFGSFLVELVVH
jgi:hypothetical protein